MKWASCPGEPPNHHLPAIRHYSRELRKRSDLLGAGELRCSRDESTHDHRIKHQHVSQKRSDLLRTDIIRTFKTET